MFAAKEETKIKVPEQWIRVIALLLAAALCFMLLGILLILKPQMADAVGVIINAFLEAVKIK